MTSFMRKVSLLLFLLCSITLFSQTITQTRAYRYNTFVAVDNDYKEIRVEDVGGIIVFSEASGMQFITVTVGDDVVFNGQVKNTKYNPVNNSERTNVYLFLMEFEGHQVPLQLFETFDLSVSNVVPKEYFVAIHSAINGEYVQGQAFKGISRIK